MSQRTTHGYWLYFEQLELFHPTHGRVAHQGNKSIISNEDLLDAIDRAAREYANRKEIRTIETSDGPEAGSTDYNMPTDN